MNLTVATSPLCAGLRQTAAADLKLWTSAACQSFSYNVSAPLLKDQFIAGSVLGTPTPAPLSWWGKVKRFCRKHLTDKIIENFKQVIASPEDSKSRIADAIMIGVLTPFAPIPVPLVAPALATGLAKICKRDTAIAMCATLYNNVFTMVPILILQQKLGEVILDRISPDNDLPTMIIGGVTMNPAAFAIGTAIMAPAAAVVARFGTILVYNRAKEPMTNILKWIVRKYEGGVVPDGDQSAAPYDSWLTHP